MADGLLSYDGTTYRLTASEVETLLARGVIVADPLTSNAFELARDHVVEELGSDLVVVEHRTGAEARGEGTEEVVQRTLAVRYSHHSQGHG